MRSIIKGGLQYEVEHLIDGVVVDRFVVNNLIPQVGIDHIAGLLRGLATPISNWYIGLFAGNYVPTMATTSADLPTTAGESVAYSETTRPAWVHAYDGVNDISNNLSRAEFTFTSDQRLYGGFVVSSEAKGTGTGVLLSIVRFPSPVDVVAGSTLRVLAGTVLVSVDA
jgi:hypothetical protein